jgi:hypothetical protein
MLQLLEDASAHQQVDEIKRIKFERSVQCGQRLAWRVAEMADCRQPLPVRRILRFACHACFENGSRLRQVARRQRPVGRCHPFL